MPLSNAERTQRYRERRYAEIDAMPKIACACGCGTLIAPITRRLEPARYAVNHAPPNAATQFKPGQVGTMLGRKNPGSAAAHRGKKLPPEEIAQRTKTRMERQNGVYQRGGWKMSDTGRKSLIAAFQKRDFTGEKNPFYGKTHTKETVQKHVARFSGANHPNWNGGTATLPYGPGFTRKYKRLILQRDQYTCQRCGKKQAELTRKLQVHHLDHDKQNNDPTNLVAACGSCNVWASYHRDEPFIS